MIRAHLALCSLLMLVVSVHAPSARAETHDTCNGFITAVPASIGTQGIYCLKQDLATSASSGEAISINANNVTLDCNGYKIGGLGGGKSTTAVGIYSYGKLNVTIRNCNIRGFHTGIKLDANSTAVGGHLVEDNRLDLNTTFGMHVLGDGSTIRGNFVMNTGDGPAYGYPRAIYTSGNVDIIDNTVSGVLSDAVLFPSGWAIGLETNASEASSVVGNRVNDLSAGGQAVGIYNGSGSGHVKVASNLITGPSSPQNSAAGILCNNGSGIAKDNIVTGWGASYLLYGCTDGGGNVLQP